MVVCSHSIRVLHPNAVRLRAYALSLLRVLAAQVSVSEVFRVWKINMTCVSVRLANVIRYVVAWVLSGIVFALCATIVAGGLFCVMDRFQAPLPRMWHGFQTDAVVFAAVALVLVPSVLIALYIFARVLHFPSGGDPCRCTGCGAVLTQLVVPRCPVCGKSV